ncbi:MAG: ATP-binding protein [Sulfitobacter sp.]|nr:ATP-binding protein [Sulfitobacter sp.]
MSDSTTPRPPTPDKLPEHLDYLKLVFVREHYEPLAKEAATAHWGHVQYLAGLVEGEALERQQRSIQRRIRQARFPVVKTLEPFQWTWPQKINRLQVQNLFRLKFIEDKANVIFLGGVGLGKTHLATALGYAACQKGHSVLFATAVDLINTLAAAQRAGRLKPALGRYLRPAVLVLDELGYLPIDKTGADLLFQIISQRYERGSIVMTSNRVFKKWPEIFNNDSTLTSALLDRLLHHAETVLIEGKSYRMKDRIES